MNVLVVGANGFLGSNIVRSVLDRGWSVRAAFNQSENNISPKVNKIQIADLDRLKNDFDLIFHSAGNFSLNHSQLTLANILLTYQICQKFTKAKIVFISSIAVYGIQQDVISETSSFNNPGFYGLSKVAGEYIVQGHKNFAITRFTNLIGSNMHQSSFVPAIIKDAKLKKVVTLKNKGKRVIDYLHVEDASDLAIKAGLSKSNGVYLGATGQSISNLEVARMVVDLIPGTKIKFSGEGQTESYYIDPQWTMKKLRWKPKKAISEGVKEVYESINL